MKITPGRFLDSGSDPWLEGIPIDQPRSDEHPDDEDDDDTACNKCDLAHMSYPHCVDIRMRRCNPVPQEYFL
jgi:hypothetical protein